MPSLDDFPDAPQQDLPEFDANGLLPDGDCAPGLANFSKIGL
jgi:hypothetical protein